MAAPPLKRIDIVINHHLQHVWRRARRESLDPHISVAREERIFLVVTCCDPTAEGKYLDWLSRWRRRKWEEGGLRCTPSGEDLGNLADALTYFHSIRRYVPVEHRDVNRYRTAADFLKAGQFLTENGRRRQREERKAEAHAGSRIIYRDQHWTLVHLQNRTAAEWWGMGTRWCTSGRTNNQFSSYASRGDLLVLNTPLGKYQFYTGTGECRDELDCPAVMSRILTGAPPKLMELLSGLDKPSKYC